ncbi:MAG: OmpH family outer membrane protein [Desulfuromonadales bacterium]|nr:OmpH family outer membrane protein [Desulfuromonadales bacterium]NIS43330.1 OmpH family outer membrane protein [Desulfuromonadales bacterium]
MKRLTLSVIAIVLLSVSPAFAAAKVGFVDLQRALNQSEAGKAAKIEISEKIQEYEGEVTSRQEELKNLKADLEKQAVLLSEEARAEKERAYQKKLKDFQRFTKDIQDELQQRDADFTRRIIDEIFEIVEQLGAEENYSVILEKTESSLLYADESIDLTDKIIEILDAKKKSE